MHQELWQFLRKNITNKIIKNMGKNAHIFLIEYQGFVFL